MFKNYSRFLLQGILSILFVTLACVEPFDRSFASDTRIILIDAKLTTDPSSNYVYIYQAIPSSGSNTSYLPVENASVEVVVDDSENISLTESSKGYFHFPGGFSGKIGSSYQLKINAQGQNLISKKEVIEAGPGIENVFVQFDKSGLKDLKGNVSASQKVYLDTRDPSDQKNYYMWDWTLYEEQFWCKSCENGRYFRDAASGPLGECRQERFRRGYLDYQCDSRCWDIFKANEVNILKDDFVNGKTIAAREVANLPIYQFIGALIDIRQYAINKAAYDYLNLVQSQGQNTGGLADTPPASLAGNVTSLTNPDQPVAGYFIVGSASRRLFWLDRKEVPVETPSIGLLDGRRPNPEPMEMDLTRPPLAPCVESNSRTALKPEGWYDFGSNQN